MSTLALRRFSSVELLRSVEPAALMQLLGRHADYFKARGVDFSSFNGHGPHYEAIVGVLVSPDATTPSALIDDLYYVDEMATKEGMDSLLAGLADEGTSLELGDEPTPADVAVRVRLLAPEVLERKHAECFLVQKRRSFEYFQSRGGAVWRFVAPRAASISAFEAELGGRLATMKRGGDCRLFVFQRPDGVWLLVRHGDPRKREGTLEKGVSGSVQYRPERYDVLRYDEEHGELAVNAEGNRKLGEHYRELVGELLFGDRKRFPTAQKYTLEPLQQLGEGAVVCADVEGIDWITLKEVKIFWGGKEGETETRSAKDLFAALRARGRALPENARLVKATFVVKFANTKTPRSVTVTHGNKATFTRDDDAPLVEQWLSLRGFVQRSFAPSSAPEARHGHAGPALANA